MVTTVDMTLSASLTLDDLFIFIDDYPYNLCIVAMQTSQRRDCSTETDGQTNTSVVIVLQSMNKLSILELFQAELKESCLK